MDFIEGQMFLPLCPVLWTDFWLLGNGSAHTSTPNNTGQRGIRLGLFFHRPKFCTDYKYNYPNTVFFKISQCGESRANVSKFHRGYRLPRSNETLVFIK